MRRFDGIKAIDSNLPYEDPAEVIYTHVGKRFLIHWGHDGNIYDWDRSNLSVNEELAMLDKATQLGVL